MEIPTYIQDFNELKEFCKEIDGFEFKDKGKRIFLIKNKYSLRFDYFRFYIYKNSELLYNMPVFTTNSIQRKFKILKKFIKIVSEMYQIEKLAFIIDKMPKKYENHYRNK